jgi:acyl-CoA synthetase (NDP forming)
VVGPNEETLARMAKANAFAAPGRIVDLTLAGTRTDVMQAALEALLDEPDYDLVIAVAGSSARFHPEILVEAIKRAAVDGARIAAFLTPDAPQAAVELTASGIPCFRTPEACGDAVAAAFARRPAKRPPLHPQHSDSEYFEEWQIDEYESYAILEALGIEAAEHALIPLDAGQSPIEYPVAVKILSSELLHKSDLGGVHIGIENDEELKKSSREIAESVKAAEPNLTFDKLLVQKMVRGVGEALLSFHDDPEAGPMVMLAAGGVLADLLKDRSLRSAPVTRAEAEAMIGEVKSLAALAGYRGKEKGDLRALADAIMAISHAGPDIVSAEVNPLIVLREGEGVKAVDAVVRVRTRGFDDDWI